MDFYDFNSTIYSAIDDHLLDLIFTLFAVQIFISQRFGRHHLWNIKILKNN